MYEIFDEYGTEKRPGLDPLKDPLPPPPKPIVVKPPTPVKKKEPEGDEEEGEEGVEESKIEPQEPEEEIFIPFVHKIMYYDFDTHNKTDPILLNL